MRRRRWGVRLADGVQWLPLLLALFVLLTRWPTALVWLLLLGALFTRLAYWRAGRAGYSQFVAAPDAFLGKTAVLPQLEEQIAIRATGPFAVATQTEQLLLRPGHYWRMPRGEHAVMVAQRPGQFLYQFMEPEMITAVQPGWLLFGTTPLPTLAVTFCTRWGPDFTDETRAYYVRDEREIPCQERTIYLTIEAEDDYQAVWASLAESP